MPNVLHQCNSLLQHGFLEAEEVVNVESHAWRCQNTALVDIGPFLAVAFQVSLLDNSPQVLQVYQLQLSELLPPVRELTDDNVVGDKAKFDLLLCFSLTSVRANMVHYRVASVPDLVIRR